LNEINNLVEKTYSKIDFNDTITKTLSLFEKSDYAIILKDNLYQGMLLRRDLMKAKLQPNTKVNTLLTHVPKISSTESIEEVNRLMIENDIYQLPVFEKDEFIGIISIENILKNYLIEDISDILIESVMNTKIITLKPDDTIGKAIKFFKEQDISNLPIVEDNKLLGNLAHSDIIDRVFHPEKKPDMWSKYGVYITTKKEKMQLPVKGIMQEQITLFSPKTPIKKVVDYMIKTNLRVVLIGKNQHIQGIVTMHDILSIMSGSDNIENIEIRFDKRIYEVKDFDKLKVEDFLNENLIRKYEEFLKEGYLYISMKEHKQSKDNAPLITCQIRLSSFRGMMYATDEGYGVIQALKNTLDALEHQIKKVKRDKKGDYSQQKIIFNYD